MGFLSFSVLAVLSRFVPFLFFSFSFPFLFCSVCLQKLACTYLLLFWIWEFLIIASGYAHGIEGGGFVAARIEMGMACGYCLAQGLIGIAYISESRERVVTNGILIQYRRFCFSDGGDMTEP